ncbi:glycosyltransferase family 39 protein [Polynucleobacter sp. AP-Latsch-80-C2]|jgi:arabinofuranosyltransferase|uniref:DUF7024 domain-containing protein n=1 Tax=Polynucleobacter sp. AP-Latsch-80-C2 TaxID=2576931 RepID=UPI001C0E4D5C|nr:glycosyltransferase family 39 protein [Polynucleobacter sp. AP-Latsch-80-C2]MBU3624406.1 glycosyltransferase family 39 protein [Polynucleobacter sp. AP-Latsch-80-C2]
MQLKLNLYLRHLALIFIAIFLVELIRTAWISDDMGFTFRPILNFLNGYGAQFNLSERVQSFTHPLWFFLLSGLTLITQNPFSAAYIACIACSLVAVFLLLTRREMNTKSLILAGICIVSSKAFIDYSSSGLENPLTNVLLVCALLLANQVEEHSQLKKFIAFFFIASCVYLSRQDAILLLAPLGLRLIYYSRLPKKLLVLGIFLGALPALAWSAISLIYYGSLVPNTAYAKLSTGIPLDQSIIQGGLYFLDSIGADSITLPVIFIGLFFGLQQAKLKPIAYGIGLYLLYIFYIGGDFMSGRFFVAPFILAIFIIGSKAYSQKQFQLLLLLFLVLGISNMKYTLLSDSYYESHKISAAGIADERGFYYQSYGLLNAKRETFRPLHWESGLKTIQDTKVICDNSISTILSFGPATHFIIDCALADPFLSKIPITPDPSWRVGHYFRDLPAGYLETIASNTNQIVDPALHDFYDVIHTIVSGSIWDLERWYAVYKLNFSNELNPFYLFLRKGFLLNQAAYPYFVVKHTGLSSPEVWGRWSEANNAKWVTLTFVKLLPKKINLLITAKGFGPNVGAPTTIKIGSSEKQIVLSNEMQLFKVPFDLSESSNTIQIIPPTPTSPKEIDPRNLDTRKLGIGIEKIAFEF